MQEDNKTGDIYVNEQTRKNLESIIELIEKRNSNMEFIGTLLKNNIIFSIVYSPASISNFYDVKADNLKIISIDINLCRLLHKYSDLEIAATILHECGHYFNPPTDIENIKQSISNLERETLKLIISNADVTIINAIQTQINELKLQKLYTPEFLADDYVGNFLPSNYLLSSLEKFVQTSNYSSPEQIEQLKTRIKRLSLKS